MGKTQTVQWSQNDALFRQLLMMGWEWEKRVAERLRSRGVDAQAKTQPLWRNRVGDAHLWRDEPDVLVRVPGNAESIEVEVKSQSHTFGDLPWSWPEKKRPRVLIETVKSLEGRGHPPSAYALVSRVTGGILSINPREMNQWFIHKTHDTVRDIEENWWACSPELLKPFSWLVTVLGGEHVPERR